MLCGLSIQFILCLSLKKGIKAEFTAQKLNLWIKLPEYMMVLNTRGQAWENISFSVYSWMHFFWPVINWCPDDKEYIKICDCMWTRICIISDSDFLITAILSIPKCVTFTHPDKTAYMCVECVVPQF